MSRTATGARVRAAVALMASCLAVTASAGQASAPPSPAGSTQRASGRGELTQRASGLGLRELTQRASGLRPRELTMQASGLGPSAFALRATADRRASGLRHQDSGSAQQPANPVQEKPKPEPAPAKPEEDSQSLPTSVENVRDGLSREPVIKFDVRPIFRIGITERRPSYYDMDAPFLFPAAPRVSTTRWHDEFLAMTTPDEVRAFSPLNTGSETLQLAATSLLFAGIAKLAQSGFEKWRDSRREGKAREARQEVDAAIAAWEAANPPVAPKPD